ncbi:MAG: hypothetical protein WCK28_00240 [Burkholderiales bacterium]|jgi:hypothetical protein
MATTTDTRRGDIHVESALQTARSDFVWARTQGHDRHIPALSEFVAGLSCGTIGMAQLLLGADRLAAMGASNEIRFLMARSRELVRRAA